MANSQTLIYRIKDGAILSIHPNKYIRNRRDLARLCHPVPHTDCSFFYFHSRFPVDPARHHISRVPGSPVPLVFSRTGAPLVFTDKLLAFKHARDNNHDVILDFADSMGDNLIRVSVALAAQEAFPETRFFCLVEDQYRDVIRLCPGITLFESHAAQGIDPKRCTTIRLNGGHLYDPRGPGFPKSCLYGLMLGLDFVPYVTRLELPGNIASLAADVFHSFDLDFDKQLFVIHCRSKGWDFRDWPKGHAAALASRLLSSFDCQVVTLGASSDYDIPIPGVVDLSGRLSWLQTLALLSRSHTTFCIDSAPMHICRAAGFRHFAIWGGTHPTVINGVLDPVFDLVTTPLPSPSPMSAITPDMVFNRAFPPAGSAPLLSLAPIRDYSQQGNQGIIFKYFQDHPATHRVFVDVGAYGIEMSNTFGLLQLGWRGLLIEAMPERCAALERDLAPYHADIVNAAIADRRGSAALYLHSAPGHESLFPDWLPETATGASLSISTQLLAPLLRRHKIPLDFDFLSIDTEGFDFRILNQFLLQSKFRPRLICCENSSFADPVAFFASFGYSLFHDCGPADGANLFFCLNS